MLLSPRLYILDLDGTLVDSLGDLTVSVNAMRSVFGLFPLLRDDVRAMVGQGARLLVQRALPGMADEVVERGLELFLDHNREHLYDRTRPYDDVVDTVAQLAGEGHTLALLSNKNEVFCRLLLQHFGMANHFALVAGADTFPWRKPSPEPLLSIMEQLGYVPEETVMVGDSINDMAAGRGAGVVTVGCSYGYGDVEELATADFVIDTFARLLEPPFSTGEVAR